jgi:hypothetical protein
VSARSVERGSGKGNVGPARVMRARVRPLFGARTPCRAKRRRAACSSPDPPGISNYLHFVPLKLHLIPLNSTWFHLIPLNSTSTQGGGMNPPAFLANLLDFAGIRAARPAATEGMEPRISPISRIQNSPSAPPSEGNWHGANKGHKGEFFLRSFLFRRHPCYPCDPW